LPEIEREYDKNRQFGWSLRKRHAVVLFILRVRLGKRLFVFLFTDGIYSAKAVRYGFYTGNQDKPMLLFASANLRLARQVVRKYSAG
jgi:hypothetical protein